ncbi:hypothetical protein J6590_074218 [Homalodisca vitripennis]|nr:hypothetical protein J6590_074218 [Homalodisca vitripennis]
MSEPIIPLLILPHESYESCHTVDGRHEIMDYVYSDVRTDHPIVDPPSRPIIPLSIIPHESCESFHTVDGRHEILYDHPIVDPPS